jgi:aspartyl-tRNA(Asn)/glutamyl-tRNA(Gln) amidotransferase subunit C
MDPLTPEDVSHIARLAYIKLSGSEAEKMRVQLTNILSHFQALASVDTEGVEPTGHTTDVHSIMRIDEPHPPLEREDVLQNAPDRDGEFMRVRPVLE